MKKSQSSKHPVFNSIKDELLYIKSRLQNLEKDKRQLLKRKQVLENQTTEVMPVINQLGTEQKIALFLDLFKGRTDVYANRWQNSKERSGPKK